MARSAFNTMPGATLAAFADHGEVRSDTITGGYDDARSHFAALTRVGVDSQGLIEALEREGLAKFEDSWQELGRTVSEELRKAGGES